MKKLLIIFSFVLSANFMIAQQIDCSLPDVDITGVNAGDKIYVDIFIDYIDPGSEIWGFQVFFNPPPGCVVWDGTINAPMPGVSYLNPLFGAFVGAFQMNWVPATDQMGWLWGDGGSFVNLDGETFPVKMVTLQFTCITPIAGPLTFETAKSVDVGGWMIKGNSDFYYNDFFESFPIQNYTDGSFFFETTGQPGLWTGNGDGINWFDPLNWDDDNVPVDIDVTINADGGKSPMVVISGGAATTANITVAAGAGIQIDPTGSLTTNGLYTNDGELLITSDGAGGSGSFIDNGGLAGIGSFVFDRYLTPGAPGTHFGWHYVSSPVSNSVSGDFAGYWLKGFDEATGMFMDIDPYSGSFCETSMNTVGIMPLMGYSVKQDLNYVIDPDCPPAEHVPTTGDNVEFGGDHLMGYGGSAQSPADPTNMAMMTDINTGTLAGNITGGGSDWNLVGNPYPSGWDYDAFFFGPNWPAGLFDAIYYWDDANDDYAEYVNGIGNPIGTDNEVAPTQAFFFNTDGTQPNVPLTFLNTERVHTPNAFYKEEKDNVLRLRASANGFTSETVIYFENEATVNFDGKFDAKKLMSEVTGAPSLYTPAGSEILSINGQPATDMVPTSFSNSLSGTYTIEAIETTTFSEVYLQDLVTGDVTDLMSETYTFDYTAGEAAERFIIHFAPVGIGENLMSGVSIWSSDNNIYVSVPKEVSGTIAVYNMMGQEVVSTDTQPGMNVIPMDNVNTYYVVKVLSSKNAITGKVYIK